jgi:hypothetical protein
MERLCPRQQATHHDSHRDRVPAPLLPARPAPRLRPHPPLRLSCQCPPYGFARTRSPLPKKSTAVRTSHRESPTSYLALPALRSQHAHRAQPYLATTGLPMQTARLFLISSPSLSLSNVPSHVYADLRLTGKMATRPLFSGLLQIAKLVLRPVPASLSTLSLLPSAVPRLLFLSSISPSAPQQRPPLPTPSF